LPPQVSESVSMQKTSTGIFAFSASSIGRAQSVPPNGFASADWALAKEDTTLQIRVETFNLFNRTNRQNPNNTADDPNAGLIFGILTPMRRMQFGLRLAW